MQQNKQKHPNHTFQCHSLSVKWELLPPTNRTRAQAALTTEEEDARWPWWTICMSLHVLIIWPYLLNPFDIFWSFAEMSPPPSSSELWCFFAQTCHWQIKQLQKVFKRFQKSHARLQGRPFYTLVRHPQWPAQMRRGTQQERHEYLKATVWCGCQQTMCLSFCRLRTSKGRPSLPHGSGNFQNKI